MKIIKSCQKLDSINDNIRRLSQSSDNDEANNLFEQIILLSDDREIRAVIFAFGSRVMKSIGQKVSEKFQKLITLENLFKAVQFVWTVGLQC